MMQCAMGAIYTVMHVYCTYFYYSRSLRQFLSYWVCQSGTGRIILVLYTAGGEELTVPAHDNAPDLVVVFKDASARTREAYDFRTKFNTTISGDPRPDLSAEGVEYVTG